MARARRRNFPFHNSMFQQIGGLKIGRDMWRCWNIGWPFTRLICQSETLEIRVFLFGITKIYRFARSEIVALKTYETAFSRGVVIEHRNEKLPKFIAFEAFPSRNFAALIEGLERSGYIVANASE